MKLDYYTICPKHYVDIVEKSQFHLVIAQWLRDKTFRVQMKKLHAAGHKFIIDNGAYEYGEAMPDEEYWDIVANFKPEIVVAPDVYRDGIETVNRTGRFLKEMDDRMMETRFEVMGVPQGKTIIEWIKCYETMASEVDVIGLPMGQWYDTTGVVRAFLASSVDKLREPRFHLLGLWNLEELKLHKDNPRVQSMDTSFPFKLAQFMKKFGDDSVLSLKMDWELPLNDKVHELAELNLKELQNYIKEV